MRCLVMFITAVCLLFFLMLFSKIYTYNSFYLFSDCYLMKGTQIAGRLEDTKIPKDWKNAIHNIIRPACLTEVMLN